MTQVDLANPTLEFLTDDPDIAARFGTSDSISYLMHSIADFLHVSENLVAMPLMFLFNLLVTWIIVYCIYYRFGRRRDYYVTYMLFSSGMFVLLWLMQTLDIQTGFVLGLFAIFGMIRYRTETVPIREMTYLFEIIGISVINGLAMTVSYTELLVTNLLFILLTWFFESVKIFKHQACKVILYDKIELVKQGREAELTEDLKIRTGLDITKLEVGHIDFLKDTAYIKVYYNAPNNEVNTMDQAIKVKSYKQ